MVSHTVPVSFGRLTWYKWVLKYQTVNKAMTKEICIGDYVRIFLDSKFGEKEGWYKGTVFRIDPYSEHRNFYWVELDENAQTILGMDQISVFNPKNIQKTE
jgi:hypothetical protein